MPSGSTVPFMSGSTRSLKLEMRLRANFAIDFRPRP
jgi:hypothetical protein